MFMSHYFSADPRAISATSDELANAASAIDQQLQGLTSELNFLMGQWTGEAANAYLTAQQGWNESMTGLHSVVFEAGSLLEGIAVRYETTEAAVVRAATA